MTPDHDDGPPYHQTGSSGTWDPVVWRELYGHLPRPCLECDGPPVPGYDGEYDHADDCPMVAREEA